MRTPLDPDLIDDPQLVLRPRGRGVATAAIVALVVAPAAGLAVVGANIPDSALKLPDLDATLEAAAAPEDAPIAYRSGLYEVLPSADSPAVWAPPFTLPVEMAARVHSDVHLYVAPLGSVSSENVELVRETLAWITGSESVTALPRRPLPAESWNPVRAMFDAQRVMTMLRELRPHDSYRLIGVTDGDLYAEKLSYLFGLASPHRDVALLSTMRLGQDFWEMAGASDLERWRVFKIVAHELGHTFGIPHCTSGKACIMRPLRNISAVDSEASSYCSLCRGHVEAALSESP